MKSISERSSAIRRGLGLFIFLMLYDGALRKWGFPGAEQVIFIIKDITLFALVAFVISKGAQHIEIKIPPTALLFLYLYSAWVFLQMLNPSLPNIAVAFWGLKAHLLYAGLILLLPVAFCDLDDLFRTLIRIYPAMVIPVCTMAFFQIALPADAYLNQSIRGDLEATGYFGDAELVRVTGTFSYLSGMAIFVQTVTLLGIGLFLGGARSPWFLAGLGTVIATLPATGSRGVLVTVIVSIFFMLGAAAISRLTTPVALLRVTISMAILLAISLILQEHVWVAIMQRAFGDAGDEYRAFTAFTNAFDYFGMSGLFGFGTGAASLGSAALVSDIAAFSWLPIGDFFEEESGRIVLELGIVGWILSLAFRLAMLYWAMTLVRAVTTPAGRAAVVIALPTVAYAAWVGNGVFAVPLANAYFWFCIALLAMAHFEKKKAELPQIRSARQATFSVATH